MGDYVFVLITIIIMQVSYNLNYQIKISAKYSK